MHVKEAPTMQMRRVPPSHYVSAILFLSACSGVIGPGSRDDGQPRFIDSIPGQQLVRRGGTVTSALGRCIPWSEDDVVLAVGSEGDLWAAGPDGVRSIEPDETVQDLPFMEAPIESALVWESRSGTMVSGGFLWRLRDDERVALELPRDVGRPTQICGDPEDPDDVVFLVTDRGLFERTDGEWFQWFMDEEPVSVERLVLEAGACAGSDNVLRFVNEGQVYRLDFRAARRIQKVMGLDDVVSFHFDDDLGGTAWLADGTLRRGRGVERKGWSDVKFERGAVQAVSQSGGRLWVIADGALFVRDFYGSWTELDVGLGPRLRSVYAHSAGGVWTESDRELCHQQIGPMLRFRGLRAVQRASEQWITFDLEATLPISTLQVRVNGVDIEPSVTSAGLRRLTVAALPLEGRGWHDVEIEAALGGSSVTRNARVEVLISDDVVWAEIEPIAVEICGECHGEGGPAPVALLTYEDWQSRATDIRERVLSGQMPRPPLSLTSEQVELIRQWVDGGMKP